MIKNIYGYVYDYSTGVMTAYPNSRVEFSSLRHDGNYKYYLVINKVDNAVTRYETEGLEGTVTRSSKNPNIYVIWYNAPSPTLAKSQFFNQIYTDAEAEETRLTKELEKAKMHTKEVMNKFANYKES